MSTKKNITNWLVFQVENLKPAIVAASASVRVVMDKILRSKTARTACMVLLAVMVMALEWLVVARHEQAKAHEQYEEWQTRFVLEYRIQQQEERAKAAAEAEEILSQEADERKQIITEIGKCIRGLKRFNYGYADFWRMAWCMDARVRSPGYSDDLLSVIQQPGQWPGYSSKNEVTAEDYKMAERVYDAITKADHPAVSNEFVFASFEMDGVTLRDTYEISSKTHFWKGEPDA